MSVFSTVAAAACGPLIKIVLTRNGVTRRVAQLTLSRLIVAPYI